MASSKLLQPPSFSRLRSSIVWRMVELLVWTFGFSIWSGIVPAIKFRSEYCLTPEYAVLLAIGGAWVLLARYLHLKKERPPAANFGPDSVQAEAIALVALPPTFPLARVSRLPLLARLLRARLEFAGNALAIKWRFGERRIEYREIARADWQHDGVLLLLRDGRRLLAPTCRPPRFGGPSGHFPELRHAVQAATFATLRHNEEVAQRIQSECARADGPSYRRAAHMPD